MQIPFLDLGATYGELAAELDAAYQRVMRSGWYIAGEELASFESEFAAYCGVRHCIGVGNGLDALSLTLRASGIGPGDEVIVPSNTYIATWLAVSHVGARVVPVEPDGDTFNVDPDRVAEALTERTRAVIPVHLYGQCADMGPIVELADDHGILVLEDAAQAQGAQYEGRRAGSLGHAAGFSFYPGKNLGAYGDAGAVVTDDDSLADRIRRLRNYGSVEKYVHDDRGYNSRLDEMQAAFLRVRLKHLDEWNARRAERAGAYQRLLAREVDMVLPSVPAYATPVWHQFVIRHPRRDAVQGHLEANGISTLIHYPRPPHLQRAYASMGLPQGAFPISERMANTMLSLPIGPHLDAEAPDQIAACLKMFSTRDTR